MISLAAAFISSSAVPRFRRKSGQALVADACRLAALDRGELPHGVLSDPELMGKLPALFRTLEGDPVDDRLLDELIETIRRE